MKAVTIDHQGGIFVSWITMNDKPVRGAAGCLAHVRAWAIRAGLPVVYTDKAKKIIDKLPGSDAIPAQNQTTCVP